MSRPLSAFRTAATLAATLLAGAALASPCTLPASFVKAPAAERAPLLRPYLVGGLAVTALQQRGGERWLELAVDSAASARRALADRTETPRLVEANGSVLLACRSLDAADARVAQQVPAPLAAPLW